MSKDCEARGDVRSDTSDTLSVKLTVRDYHEIRKMDEALAQRILAAIGKELDVREERMWFEAGGYAKFSKGAAFTEL